MTPAVRMSSPPAMPTPAATLEVPPRQAGAVLARRRDARCDTTPSGQGRAERLERREAPAIDRPDQTPPAHQIAPTAYQIWISDSRSGDVYCYDILSTREAALDICHQIERVMLTRTHIVSIVTV